jgi:endonuclease-3
MPESLESRRQRTKTIIQRLTKHYPDAHCALDHGSPIELLMATVLSAQCTDERVNKVTPRLFARYKSAKAYADAEDAELENIIRSTGFFRAKSRSIKGIGRALQERHGGQVPRELEALTSLPGVGRKTANVVLGNAFGLATGIVVDTHVKRLAFRLGLTREKTPEKVEHDLLKLVREKDWIQFSHWLITHGRQVCKARSPQCDRCFLSDLCPKRGVLTASDR